MKLLKIAFETLVSTLEPFLPDILGTIMLAVALTTATGIPAALISCVTGYPFGATWNVVIPIEASIVLLWLIIPCIVNFIRKIIKRYKSE